MVADKIIIIDLGSQTNQLIARRIRDLGVYSEMWPPTVKAETIRRDETIKGIILSGGPLSVYRPNAFTIDPEIFSLNLPILGICYGMQLINKHFGGTIEASKVREYGLTHLEVNIKNSLFQGLDRVEDVWMSHGDIIKQLASPFETLAQSKHCPVASMAWHEKHIYGVQFHPEVRDTVHGNEIISNFVFVICQARKNWTMEHFIEREIDSIREKVKNQKVILGLSGGVDSSVCALLLSRAIGKQLTCIFVDHGLLRKNEAKNVMATFKHQLSLNVIKIDAKQRFLTALKGIVDPEKKRKVIGRTFIEVFNDAAKQMKDVHFLAQGTLYTDVIESGTTTAQTIKSHHNVGGLPKRMKLVLIEPLNTLFKDEVRELGKLLNLPETIINRQPFPGPGLAIRILGEVTSKAIRIVKETDGILHDTLAEHNLTTQIWQFFTVLTPLKTVGVMGDKRTYDHVLAIRAVTSIDGMTATWARIPYKILDQLSRRMINEVPGINRVVYDITSKPPGTIEWE